MRLWVLFKNVNVTERNGASGWINRLETPDEEGESWGTAVKWKREYLIQVIMTGVRLYV